MPITAFLNQELDLLRRIGDPALEEAFQRTKIQKPWEDYVKLVSTDGLTAAAATDSPWNDGWKTVSDLVRPPQEDFWPVLQRARTLFGVYGQEICAALLLAALPEAYAAQWGSEVIGATNLLRRHPIQRIRGTAQFLATVMTPTEHDSYTTVWARDGVAWEACVGLRLFHHAVRQVLRGQMDSNDAAQRDAARRELAGSGDPQNPDCPINQEDLIATRCTFSVSVFEVLEKFGILWSGNDQWDYLATWNQIGVCLGICDQAAGEEYEKEYKRIHGTDPSSALSRLMPSEVGDARHLVDQLRKRQWPPIYAYRYRRPHPPQRPTSDPPSGLTSVSPGRTLVQALLATLSNAMPRGLQSWPLAVMRQLVPEVVGYRLALGTNGAVLSALEALPGRTVTVARFTGLRRPNPLSAAILRQMANEVVRRSIVTFLAPGQDPPFVLPGLEPLAHGLSRRSPRRVVFRARE